MHKIYVIMGKSSSGKDTIFSEVLKQVPELQKIKPCTTRPKRDTETGEEYNFVSKDEFEYDLLCENVVEYRVYDTVYGEWIYYERKADIDLRFNNYITITTLEGYKGFINSYDKEDIVPIYIDIDEKIRLARAIKRELKEDNPKIEELARRFIEDQKDFSDEKLAELGIEKRYSNNESLEDCVNEITKDIGWDLLVRKNRIYKRLV